TESGPKPVSTASRTVNAKEPGRSIGNFSSMLRHAGHDHCAGRTRGQPTRPIGRTKLMTRHIAPLALLALLLSNPGAAAQTFPARPVTIISSTPAGALNDVLARAVGQRLSEKWGQPVVIENRPGAAYAIA